MDKRELSQLKYISTEIEELKKQIENVRSSVSTKMVSDTVLGSSRSLPYAQHVIGISGVEDVEAYERRIQRLENKLKLRIDELMNKFEDMEEYIASISDSEMRLIIQYRYINGLSWQQIAANMGTQGDGSTERKKLNRFFKFS